MTSNFIFPGGPRLGHSCCLEVGSVCMQGTGYGEGEPLFESKMLPQAYALNACFPAGAIYCLTVEPLGGGA